MGKMRNTARINEILGESDGYSKTIRESMRMVKIMQIKICRKKRHVRIDNMGRMPKLICGKVAAGEI